MELPYWYRHVSYHTVLRYIAGQSTNPYGWYAQYPSQVQLESARVATRLDLTQLSGNTELESYRTGIAHILRLWERIRMSLCAN